MSYDLYVELGGNSQQDADALTQGSHRSIQIADIATCIRLLAGIAAQNESVKDYAVSGDRNKGGGYKSLVHAKDPKQHAKDPKPKQSVYATALIAKQWPALRTLGLLQPSMLLDSLPPGSWFLQFAFTLAKPWISKDDDPFYVAESVNPVRKDKVFKVPVMSAAAWKGLLRWTLMRTRLALKKDSLTPKRFAQERFVQTLLFGDEKGEEGGATKDFAAYLDALQPQARPEYERLLRAYYDLKADDPLPHHSGRLMFYPTFFDLIDVEVINPHSRRTKAGTHPIYLECVPAGAQGTFSLLYVPFDLIGQPEGEIKKQAAEDLQRVAEGLQAMFLTYGFSAKRSSGYGVAKETVTDGRIETNLPDIVQHSPPEEPVMPTTVSEFLAQFPGEDFSLKPDEWRKKHNATNTQREQYKNARKDHQQYQENRRAYADALAQWNAKAQEPQLLQRSFDSFDKLVEVAKSIAEPLTQGGER